MNLFKKFFKEREACNKVELYSLNWFIHVLINNVGYNKWVRMSKKEQIEYDKTNPHNKGYPYKVITYPIPKGKDIILKDDGTFKISCNSEYTRNLIIEMARSYDSMEHELRYLQHEKCADSWHTIDELPPHSMASSFHERGRRFLVFSPTLCYVNGGICFGFRDGEKWYIILNGKEVEHKVTHYRHLPPRPNITLPSYEEVKNEAEKLCKIRDLHL